ncbi:hypothetical protein Q3G72_014464 [Acer saccharum]|nr:hypothetical protein Q3G72_014464 [Acer saccharum]
MVADDIGLPCLNEKFKPRCGLEFDGEQLAYDFYNAYRRSMGFSVKKETYGRNKRTDEHNHPLVMPKCAHMLPSQRTLSSSQAIEVDLAEESGISLKFSYELLGKQVGGRESLSEEQITNIFGADARMAMSVKTPKTILTYQDATMAKAISHVMPNTYHRICTWHMMQNVLKHVNGVFRGPGRVKSILSKFIDDIEEENQFLIALNEMLEKILSRASLNEKVYNLANAHASNLAKLVENTLRLEMDDNIHEKDVEYQDVDVEVECTQDSNLVKAKGLKKRHLENDVDLRVVWRRHW